MLIIYTDNCGRFFDDYVVDDIGEVEGTTLCIKAEAKTIPSTYFTPGTFVSLGAVASLLQEGTLIWDKEKQSLLLHNHVATATRKNKKAPKKKKTTYR